MSARAVDEVLRAARALAAAVESWADRLLLDPHAALAAPPQGPLAGVHRALLHTHVAAALAQLAEEGRLADPPAHGRMRCRLPDGSAVDFSRPVAGPVVSDALQEVLTEPAKPAAEER